MAETDNLPEFLTGIADAIRYQENTTDSIPAEDFASRITGLERGTNGAYNIEQIILDDSTCELRITDADGSSNVGGITPSGTINITENGVHDVINYANAEVHVVPKLQEKTVNQNGEVVADDGYDGLSKVVVEVPVDSGPSIVSAPHEFDIVLTESTGLEVKLNLDGNKDWGDGTKNTETTHTYANYGEYTITCDGVPTRTYNLDHGIFEQGMLDYNRYCVAVRWGTHITSVAECAFSYCSSLKSVELPENLIGIEKQAFFDCDVLESVMIPDSVTSIGSNAFYGCTSLVRVSLPNSITAIGYSAFFGTAIKTIIIPESVADLGSSTFGWCKSLMSVVIPEKVTALDGVFNTCSSLTTIVIPRGVETIGYAAFFGCSALVVYDFTSHTAVPTMTDMNAFANHNESAKIIVPDNLYDEWISAENWSTYSDIIYKASEV